MTPELKDRLAKIYELVNHGTDGEKVAAKNALDRIIKRYDIDEEQLQTLNQKRYLFNYATQLDEWLFVQLVRFFIPHCSTELFKRTWAGKPVKNVGLTCSYLDWVTIESTYEYYRRHMKKQWQKVSIPILKRCRTNKTRAERRTELQELFFSQYLIKSNLYNPSNIQTVNVKSDKEYKDRLLMKTGVEGGIYNKQVQTNLMLE